MLTNLRMIVSLAEGTTDQVRSIATASEQQSATSEQISHSLDDINRVSLETSEAMRHSTQAIESLAHQANILERLLTDLKADDSASHVGAVAQQ